MPVNRHDIPVIVLNWNGWDDTRECIQSILQSGDQCPVWVVDNGSDDRRGEELVGEFSFVRFVQLEENFGWAGGYNRALKVAIDEGYESAFLLNNDTLVEPGFYQRACAFVPGHRCAAVGSLVLHGDGKSVRFNGRYFEKGVEGFVKQVGAVSVRRVNGGAMLVNLNAYQEVGGFDERFFCYGEESDWCERAVDLLGYENYVCLDSVVRHHCEGSDVSGNSLYYRTRNKFIKTETYEPCMYELVSSGYRRAKRLAEAGETDSADTILCAVQDGVRQQFGRRASMRPFLKSLLLLKLHRSYRIGRLAVQLDLRIRRNCLV